MITIRMSASGYCPRKLTAILLGREGSATPKWLKESAEEGNWHEARLKDELRALGCQVTDEQRELHAVEGGLVPYEQIGHIDGRTTMSSKVRDSLFTIHYIDCVPADVDWDSTVPHLLEVKTFSFLEHQRWIAEGWGNYFKSYAVQHTCYRNALNEQLSFLATKDRSGGTRNLYVIGKDPVSMASIKEQLKQVAEHATLGDLVPTPFNPESLECRRCQFRSTECLVRLPQVDDNDVVVAAQDYLDGKEQEAMGKLLKEQSRDTLIAYAKRKQLNRWDCGGSTVTFSSFPREDVSIRGLLAIMPREQFAEAITVSKVERITVVNSSKESE